MRSIKESGAIPNSFSQELMRRVEEEWHDSGLVIHPGITVAPLALVLHAIGPGVPVLMREPKESSPGVKKGKVHSPRIDSESGYVFPILLHSQFETVEDLPVKTEDVPDKPAWQVSAWITETVNILQFQGLQVCPSSEDTTTACPKVDGEVNLLFHGFRLDSRGVGLVPDCPCPK